jgi:Lamin Tail Domain
MLLGTARSEEDRSVLPSPLQLIPALLVAILALAPLVPPTAEAQPVISQIYGGGGNLGATYTHDFIELFNPTDAPISLAGWSIQYTSATGTGDFGFTAAELTPLAGVIQPGQYFLIRGDQGALGTIPLPAADITDPTPINLSATGGRVALVTTTVPLGCNGGSNPCSPTQLAGIVDLVGWGSADFALANPAPATNTTTALVRAGAGCTDTGDNAADFSTAAPVPRNSASPRQHCTSLSLALTLNRDAAAAGDAVEASLYVTNAGSDVAVDVYFIIVLPPGATAGCSGDLALLFVANGGADFPVLCASRGPGAFKPYLANVTIPGPSSATVPSVLSLTWPPGAPPGLYTFVILATPPGALRDGVLDESDILTIGVAELTATP